MKKRKHLFGIICLLLLVASYLIFLNRLGLISFRTVSLELTSFTHDSNYAWIADGIDPNITMVKISDITLTENDIEIKGNPAWSTETVQDSGKGSFVVWNNGTVCFSTTDNSSPNENGRKYIIQYPYIVGNRSARYLFSITACAIFFYILIYVLVNAKRFVIALKNILRIITTDKTYTVILLWTIVFYLALEIRFLVDQPLWGDEIFTLKNYVFQENWYYPATTYNYPNNHIFYSLFLAAYTRLHSISAFCEVVQNPRLIRSVHLFFSSITIISTSFTIWKNNRTAGIISLALFSFTIPFYAWITQMRGYSLSIMLMSLIMLLYEKNKSCPQKYSLLLLSVICALFIYCMPSNVVYILALIIFESFLTIRAIIRQNKADPDHGIFKNMTLVLSTNPILCSLLLSGVFSLFLYLPILSQVKDNFISHDQTTVLNLDKTAHLFRELFRGMTNTYKSFIGTNYLLLILLLCGFFITIKHLREYARKQIVVFSANLIVLILPVFLYGIVRTSPFTRNFLPVIPNYIFVAATGISALFDLIKSQKIKTTSFFVLVLLSQVLLYQKALDFTATKPATSQTSLVDLSKHYFIENRNGLNATLSELKNQQQINLPVIFSYPQDYYIEATCECFEITCFYDESKPSGMSVIEQKAPYWLIQTNWIDQPTTLRSQVFIDQCILINHSIDENYALYSCNQ